MSEQLELFTLSNRSLGPISREKFYNDLYIERIRSRKVSAVWALIMDAQQRIILQKRSLQKERNPGMLDASVGGHIIFGDTDDSTIAKECQEELGIPAIVSEEQHDPSQVCALHKVGQVQSYLSPTLHNNTLVDQSFIASFYIGKYFGPITFVDGEVLDAECYSIPDLQKKILTNPEQLTGDVLFMIKHYASAFTVLPK